jgi:hypothetical protein
MANRIHRPLNAIAFNANHTRRQRYALSKQMQDLYLDVALVSETRLKPHDGFLISNDNLYHINHHPGIKAGTAVAVRKGIPHNHVDLPLLISIEATGVCIRIGNSEILLATVNKSPGRAWSDADITELLSIRNKCILAGDLKPKHQL